MTAAGFIKKAIGLSLVGFVLSYLVILADHLYMVNADTYPQWASEPIVIASDGDGGDKALSALCAKPGGWNYYVKNNGVFMRCSTIITGSTLRPKTYLILNIDQLASENN